MICRSEPIRLFRSEDDNAVMPLVVPAGTQPEGRAWLSDVGCVKIVLVVSKRRNGISR